MVETNESTAAGPGQPVGVAAPGNEALTDRQLAKAVLARTVRPKVGEVRRLAEAVLAKELKKGKSDKPSDRKGRGKKPKAAKNGGKLAKIPGQKKKKN